MSEQQVPVPIAATLAVTQRQRNSLADENAMLWAHVEQLTAELAQLRGDGEVSGSSTSSSSSV